MMEKMTGDILSKLEKMKNELLEDKAYWEEVREDANNIHSIDVYYIRIGGASHVPIKFKNVNGLMGHRIANAAIGVLEIEITTLTKDIAEASKRLDKEIAKTLRNK